MKVAAAVLVAITGVAAAKPTAWRQRTTDGPELAARIEEAIRNHDGAAMQAIVGDAVAYDGVWFADAGCAKRFAARGLAEGAEAKALAQCLVRQKTIATTRRTSRFGGAILTFDPGVEVELGFRDDRLVLIATPWTRDAERGSPALTVQLFEALRTAGTTRLDAVVKLAAPASAWIKVCLDKAGAVASTTVVEARPAASAAAFTDAIADWRFRPFEHKKQKLAACSLSLLTYPADGAPATEVLPQSPSVMPARDSTNLESPYEFNFDGVDIRGAPQTVAPSVLEANRLKGTKQIDPDPITKVDIVKAAKDRVIASLKMCLDTTGKVTTVALLKSSGFSVYDHKLQREMRGWAYKPFLVNGSPAPVCTAVTFIYRPNP